MVGAEWDGDKDAGSIATPRLEVDDPFEASRKM